MYSCLQVEARDRGQPQPAFLMPAPPSIISTIFSLVARKSFHSSKRPVPFSTVAKTMAQAYKIKGLSKLDLQTGEKREVEVDGIEGGKVLLVKVGDKTHALGPKCTHYGAPLKNGVLTPDGRLTCQWHGACFNVASGDVEDAPALDHLASFQISEKDGAVFIHGEEGKIKTGRRAPLVQCSAGGHENILIVGGGSATIGAIQSLRENGSKSPITVIHKEPYLPIDRTKLSKALIADASKLQLRDQAWFDKASVKTIQDVVVNVDFTGKTVSTESGKSYPYSKLILATGGTPRRLSLPGFKDLSNIFVLRNIPDVQAILSAIGEEKGRNIVVIGSSFIGMEVSNAISSNHNVSIIGMESTPLERVMGVEVGKIFQSNLTKNGVKFHMSASVDSAKPSPSDPSKVGSVALKDGTTIPADLVILGVGVTPATEFLKSNPLISLEKDGSLRTDEFFLVEGIQDVYAIGDIATYPYHGPGGNGKHIRIEHWNVAQNAGRSVGHTIASPSSARPKPFIPIFWSALGSNLRYCGATHGGYDDLVINGKPEEGKFAAYYGKEGAVVAVATMGMDPIMAQSAELMRRGNMPSIRDIAEGTDVLAVDVPAEVKI